MLNFKRSLTKAAELRKSLAKNFCLSIKSLRTRAMPTLLGKEEALPDNLHNPFSSHEDDCVTSTKGVQRSRNTQTERGCTVQRTGLNLRFENGDVSETTLPNNCPSLFQVSHAVYCEQSVLNWCCKRFCGNE